MHALVAGTSASGGRVAKERSKPHRGGGASHGIVASTVITAVMGQLRR